MFAQIPHTLADWTAWKRGNADKIRHIAGFEEQFVDTILAKIPSVSPADVVAQYEFICNKGRKRRIDFVIVNEEKGYFLAIELDGANKTNGQIGEDWTDFLQRQNSLLLTLRALLLRYSNTLMRDRPTDIISQISGELSCQKAAKELREEQSRSELENKRQDARRQENQQRTATDLEGRLRSATELELQLSARVRESLLAAKEAESRLLAARDLEIRLSNVGDRVSTPQPSSYTWPKFMTSSVVVFAFIIVGCFIWQHNFQQYTGGEKTPSAIASVGSMGKLQPPTAVASGIAQQIPDPPIASTHVKPKADITNAEPKEFSAAPASVPMKPTTPSTYENSPPETFIPASQAQAYIGQNKRVCGQIAGLKETSAGLFVNLDRPYPNDAMTAVIWRAHLDRVGRSKLTENGRVCISGIIGAYRGKPQIEVENSDQISQ